MLFNARFQIYANVKLVFLIEVHFKRLRGKLSELKRVSFLQGEYF